MELRNVEHYESLNKRNHPRFSVPLSIVLKGTHEGNGIVRNVSRAGCQVEGQMAIHVGDRLTLRLSFAAEESPVDVEAASVRWSTGNHVGLAFLLMDEEEQTRLQRYLSKVPGASEDRTQGK